MAMLERRELGNTGLQLSCVGFGASPLGKVFGDVSHEDALAAVRLALQLGINFFDTSPYYGGTVSETVLGNCLHELNVPREEIVVSTKCGRYKEGFDFSAERVTRSIDESLARLNLDYVDILHCHDIEFGSLDQKKMTGWLLVGKTSLAIGISRELGSKVTTAHRSSEATSLSLTGVFLTLTGFRSSTGSNLCQTSLYCCSA